MGTPFETLCSMEAGEIGSDQAQLDIIHHLDDNTCIGCWERLGKDHKFSGDTDDDGYDPWRAWVFACVQSFYIMKGYFKRLDPDFDDERVLGICNQQLNTMGHLEPKCKVLVP